MALVTDDDPPPALTPSERAVCNALGSDLRRGIWLRGRRALKAVLHRLGEDPDTTSIAFPHPRLSLSHCARTAVAVGLDTAASVRGIGVDLELERTPPENSTRFFLTPEESAWLESVSENERHPSLRRLWTAKEAVYKADPRNQGRLLTDYRLQDPANAVGRAGDEFLYASLAIPNGMVSLAVLPVNSFDPHSSRQG